MKGRRSRRPKVVKRNCIFCKEKKEPSYREYELLSRYVTERAKIIPLTRSGTCKKHQRKLSIAIKHARLVGLLPFIVRPY